MTDEIKKILDDWWELQPRPEFIWVSKELKERIEAETPQKEKDPAAPDIFIPLDTLAKLHDGIVYQVSPVMSGLQWTPHRESRAQAMQDGILPVQGA